MGPRTSTESSLRSTAPAERSPSLTAKPMARAGIRMLQVAGAESGDTRASGPSFRIESSSTTLRLPSPAGALSTMCRASRPTGAAEDVSCTASTTAVSGRDGLVLSGSAKYWMPA